MLRIGMDELPQVRIMGQIRQPFGWKNQVDHLSSNILILVKGGRMIFETDGNIYALESGDYLFLPSGSKGYRVHSENGCQYAFIHFLAKIIQEKEHFPPENNDTAGHRPQNIPYTLLPSRQRYIEAALHGALGNAQEKIWRMLIECDLYRYEMTQESKLRIDLCFAEILCLLDRGSTKLSRETYPAVLSKMLLYIHEHYMEPITLAHLSEEFHLTRQYVMRLFQQHLRTTVTHYIQQIKLVHAQELLRYSTFRVNEVAEILGFGSAYYFCRLFKRQFQMTPTEFIRQELGRNTK